MALRQRHREGHPAVPGELTGHAGASTLIRSRKFPIHHAANLMAAIPKGKPGPPGSPPSAARSSGWPAPSRPTSTTNGPKDAHLGLDVLPRAQAVPTIKDVTGELDSAGHHSPNSGSAPDQPPRTTSADSTSSGASAL